MLSVSGKRCVVEQRFGRWDKTDRLLISWRDGSVGLRARVQRPGPVQTAAAAAHCWTSALGKGRQGEPWGLLDGLAHVGGSSSERASLRTLGSSWRACVVVYRPPHACTKSKMNSDKMLHCKNVRIPFMSARWDEQPGGLLVRTVTFSGDLVFRDWWWKLKGRSRKQRTFLVNLNCDPSIYCQYNSGVSFCSCSYWAP